MRRKSCIPIYKEYTAVFELHTGEVEVLKQASASEEVFLKYLKENYLIRRMITFY